MKQVRLHTNSGKETQDIAYQLGKKIQEPIVLLMRGDLGAGKTTFTQGLAKGLQIQQTVNSPTFTILKIYQGRLPLYHIDAYRLEGVSQDLGFEEYIDSDGVCVIEWPMYIEELLPREYLDIELLHDGEDCRTMRITAYGEKAEKLLEEWV